VFQAGAEEGGTTKGKKAPSSCFPGKRGDLRLEFYVKTSASSTGRRGKEGPQNQREGKKDSEKRGHHLSLREVKSLLAGLQNGKKNEKPGRKKKKKEKGTFPEGHHCCDGGGGEKKFRRLPAGLRREGKYRKRQKRKGGKKKKLGIVSCLRGAAISRKKGRSSSSWCSSAKKTDIGEGRRKMVFYTPLRKRVSLLLDDHQEPAGLRALTGGSKKGREHIKYLFENPLDGKKMFIALASTLRGKECFRAMRWKREDLAP